MSGAPADGFCPTILQPHEYMQIVTMKTVWSIGHRSFGIGLIFFSVAAIAARLLAVIRSCVLTGTLDLPGGFTDGSLVYVAPIRTVVWSPFDPPKELICIGLAHQSVSETCVSYEKAPGGAVLLGPFV